MFAVYIKIPAVMGIFCLYIFYSINITAAV
nr:MAG TPA: hypothetical protein [Caudoviricetes sp.]DAR10027.1 MAG TPA: hypothetical protein [Caudoviricetes sp.]DAX61441.1 MAG TPA: hypothetical protein [Caudoviricetes sp.]DAZ13016.1 MAG TPA: hypothetical protein [Caudoviricetes sp.]